MVSVFDFADKLKQNPPIELFTSFINEVEQSHSAEDIQEMQFDKGEDNQGNILGYYSYATEIITRGRKKAGDPFTLYDTGAFRKGLYLSAYLSNYDIQFEISSTDDKTSLLVNKLGDRIFGISNQNIPLFSEKIKEILIKKLNSTIP